MGARIFGANPSSIYGVFDFGEILLEILKEKGNNIVVSGDTHTALGADVINVEQVHGYKKKIKKCNEYSSAVEFAPPSVSRGNWDEGVKKALKLDGDADVTWKCNYIRAAMAKANPHHAFLDITNHGYGILTVTKEKVKADYYWVDITKAVDGDKVEEKNGATLVMKDGDQCWDRGLSKIPKYARTFKGVLGGHIKHGFKRLGGHIKTGFKKLGGHMKKLGGHIKTGFKKAGKWFKGLFSADDGYDDYYEMYYDEEDAEVMDELYYALYDEYYGYDNDDDDGSIDYDEWYDDFRTMKDWMDEQNEKKRRFKH